MKEHIVILCYSSTYLHVFIHVLVNWSTCLCLSVYPLSMAILDSVYAQTNNFVLHKYPSAR